jgi:enamine deaminase RidA (YjgF/YER057c/UK114 family)
MNTIDVTHQNAASLLVLEAMCEKVGDGDILEVFKVGTDAKVEVKMFVNDVEVDVVQALNEAWERLEAVYEKNLLEKAKELVSMTKFEDLSHKLERAAWDIEQALEAALKQK